MEIAQLVDQSLAESRDFAPFDWNSAHGDDVRAQFLSERIVPELREVKVEAHVALLIGLAEGKHSVYFVTDSDPQSVFYDPHTKSFGSAWGPEKTSGEYVDLGFRSADVLAMAVA
jgi:hypothetical protein